MGAYIRIQTWVHSHEYIYGCIRADKDMGAFVWIHMGAFVLIQIRVHSYRYIYWCIYTDTDMGAFIRTQTWVNSYRYSRG